MLVAFEYVIAEVAIATLSSWRFQFHRYSLATLRVYTFVVIMSWSSDTWRFSIDSVFMTEQMNLQKTDGGEDAAAFWQRRVVIEIHGSVLSDDEVRLLHKQTCTNFSNVLREDHVRAGH